MEVPSYQSRLLGELNEQRKRDFFCDCSVLVEGRLFKAHRNVLFASSGYFRALLVRCLQEPGRPGSTAVLDIVTADAFALILDFVYSGRLELRSDNVIEVMSAASYLQMTDAVSTCKSFIRSSLEICSREREGLADSGTGGVSDEPALPPSSEREGSTRGEELPGFLPVDLALKPPPAPSSSSVDKPSHSPPSSSSSPCSSSSLLLMGLANPKTEFDPDEEGEESVEEKPPFHAPPPDCDRPSPCSQPPSSDGYPVKQFLEALLRGGGGEPRREELLQHFNHSLGGGSSGEEGGGFSTPSLMEIHSDWYGEDTGAVSHGLKRFGLCDGCTCVTTTHEDPAPINLSQSEGAERSDGDGDWPVYIGESGEAEPRGREGEELDDKHQLHRQLSECEGLM
ncbi:Zinc finger and BTB domain-containing protein 8B [Acipenser ruthenus]|uniref:Zinc finger and BTB domain-containing protein 8B n=1 Tax=Acipenser ruthenus TaxID=7906 RepID=A0A444UI81_ACIRT|nr:Zinc finger and BTB domain-containing protein 8B [Acipenser ruthenus]